MKGVLGGMVEGGLLSWCWRDRLFEEGSSVLGKRTFLLHLDNGVRVGHLVVRGGHQFRSLGSQLT